MESGAFTAEEVAQLRASFIRFIPHSDAVATEMYSRLFAGHPEVQSLFTTDQEQQRDKLVHTLAVMIDALSTRGNVDTVGHALGARHKAYGVTDGMYVTLKPYLVEALQTKIDPPFTDEELGLWSRLYDEIMKSMTS